MAENYHGRVGLQQRVVPSYRAAFLEALAKECQGGLGVLAGKPGEDEGIESVTNLNAAQLTWSKNRYFLDPASPFFLFWQRGFLQWLQAWQPEVLIVEANPRYLVTRQAIGWMHEKGRKVIGWGLGAPPIKGGLAGFRQRERLSFIKQLDAIIAYSRKGAEEYRQLGFPPERVYVASNAVEAAPIHPPVQRNLKSDQPLTVLFVGRLQSRKRVDMLIQACEQLPETLQPRVIIVGDGPAEDELQQQAHNYPPTEFTGAKHGAELEPYFAMADVFVLPGTGGLAIQQAMAHGLPVIVAKGDGTQDDLVRDENGWQVPPDDLPALTSILREALSDPARLRRMGEASYRIVATEINLEAMVRVFIRALNSL